MSHRSILAKASVQLKEAAHTLEKMLIRCTDNDEEKAMAAVIAGYKLTAAQIDKTFLKEPTPSDKKEQARIAHELEMMKGYHPPEWEDAPRWFRKQTPKE